MLTETLLQQDSMPAILGQPQQLQNLDVGPATW